MTNFEFKAHVQDFAHVRAIIQKRRAHFAGILEQTDTYFAVPNGRLKLRETKRHATAANRFETVSQLIFYQRGDEAALKRSDYYIIAIEAADDLLKSLAAALGVRVVVKKMRELFLLAYESTAEPESPPHIRVHFDRVEELGEFIEVEAVAGGNVSFTQAENEARALLQEFGIFAGDLLADSYSDLLLKSTPHSNTRLAGFSS